MVKGVVITGAGLVSPLGKNLKETLGAINAGRSGIRKIERADGWPEYLKYAGSIDELPDLGQVDRKLLSQMKFLNRGAILGFHSAREAVESSGISLDDVPMERRAFYLASGDMTNIDHHFLYEAMRDATRGKWQEVDTARLNDSSLSKVNPFFLLESITNNLFSFLSSYYGLMGANTSMGTLSPGGSCAVELAARSIAEGRADMALAVGCGSWVGDVSTYEQHGLGVLSDAKAGAASYRPFDASRDGFIPGEGGATLLLESEERARARGAKILGRIKGTGNSIEHTGGEGFDIPEKVHERSVRQALEDAGVGAEELGMVIAHGAGTQRGDRSELSSIASVLNGARARGAKILGRIKGAGNSVEHTGGEGFDIPDRVHERSVRQALEDAGVGAEELGMVIAHGAGTQRGDRSELSSIASVLNGAKVPLCGLKPYTGHMGAASDVAEIIIGINSVANKSVPATLNFNFADSEFKEMKISSSPQSAGGHSFISMSYGVGGQSSAVVVEVG